MKNHKVSIIIPCFNNEKTIERCVLSALKQTHRNIEIICINDGSSDNSWNILVMTPTY
ncbi:glycosyltransferase family 2 protein [Escherichia coli]|uniref:glycosyltransferase family 2 protein n=1 Tax=Escherichia coli TaxID=562 RepID=UPI00201B5FA2|nr:glycosyltransferase family 2 protein [Escherichia coli]